MSTVVLLRLLAPVASALLLACSGGGAPATAQPEASSPPRTSENIDATESEPPTDDTIGPEWRELLRCSLEHDQACKERLEDLSSQTGDSALSQLATALLDEWELDPEHEQLSRPRLIWMDLPEIEELEQHFDEVVPYSIVIASGVVGQGGRIVEGDLLRGSDSEWLNKRVLDAFREALFRPAIKDGSFVEKRTEYVYRLHPR